MKSSPLFGPSNEKHLLDQIRQHPVVLPKYPKYLKESTYTGNYQEMDFVSTYDLYVTHGLVLVHACT